MHSRDWGGLRAIIDLAVEDHRSDVMDPPVACPNDGSPLVERDGMRNCPMGDYRWCG